MSATIHDFVPSPAAKASIRTGSGVAPQRSAPALHLVTTAEADELTLLAQLLMACAPPRRDAIEACPAVKKREGFPWQGVVMIEDRGLTLIASADAIRRMAVAVSSAGRAGAALDLMQAADQAEALAAHYQRGTN